MDDPERKELIKFNLLREDSLNNSRLTWLLSFQAFLFTIYALSQKPNVFQEIEGIARLIPFIGIISTLVTFYLITAGIRSIKLLHDTWNSMVGNKKKDITPFGIQKKGQWYFLLILSSGFIPLSCFVSWVSILIFKCI